MHSTKEADVSAEADHHPTGTTRAVALIIFVALTVHAAQAADPPEAPRADRCVLGFAPARSVEEAVLTMSRCFLRSSIREDREFIGAVLRTDGGYSYFVQRGEQGRGSAQLRLPRRRGQQLVAFWHTHGAPGPARHLFSATDTRLVARTNVPLYLTDPAGAIRVYRPGDDRDGTLRAARSALRVPQDTATGSLVASRLGWRVSAPGGRSVDGDD